MKKRDLADHDLRFPPCVMLQPVVSGADAQAGDRPPPGRSAAWAIGDEAWQATIRSGEKAARKQMRGLATTCPIFWQDIFRNKQY
ncbi:MULTISPECIES: hypothetical protein [unclassified Mesorhizobium]|uniref:hypothetical protein n=1 Tax=unclassified Mesorhizobium TaxID=325217 RepID=UPI000F755EDE|nr:MULTISPECIES: hypothetical protein [unclassified Mesorhizobium]RWX57880.1 hypothetical protein EN780_38440 [Mesorhizobium sp. M4B.F.Ca.ET.089.01.1.1]TGT60981.1 hypothetical protein EN813_018580 [Mesorhizobium sp. M00.F.Ca.ET.170.01.1.1]AZO08748.1 hypothetical protein EJ074_06200 [Mesorhizobium sp. M3A.F.Ca.ET.080.04.2.1]RWB72127.1 MAG: hypothetical protein EOQ49_12855 [Mesorhizobium sp.]RWB83668.1 MAG: hypothetical protein EOQ52_26025 [Mesorhizobium sp.]